VLAPGRSIRQLALALRQAALQRPERQLALVELDAQRVDRLELLVSAPRQELRLRVDLRRPRRLLTVVRRTPLVE
jgi:hypothetical protein